MFKLYGSPALTPQFIERACSVLPEPRASELRVHLQLPEYAACGEGTGLCAALGWPEAAMLDETERAAIHLLKRMTEVFGVDRISVEDALEHRLFDELIGCRDPESEVRRFS